MQRDNIHKGTIARLEVDCAYWILFKCKYTTIYIAPLLFLEGRFIKYELNILHGVARNGKIRGRKLRCNYSSACCNYTMIPKI